MVSLEQIHSLENKITRACEIINALKKENASLRKAVDSSQRRMNELEHYINQFKTEQIEIESGIVSALKKLDDLEDDVSESKSSTDSRLDQTEQVVLKKGNTEPDQSTKKAEKEGTGKDTTILRETAMGNSSKEKNSGKEQEGELDIF
jgi:FtsZ-binding cell division protein ZapB